MFDINRAIQRKGPFFKKPPPSIRGRWRAVERWWLGVLSGDPFTSMGGFDREVTQMSRTMIGLGLYVFLGKSVLAKEPGVDDAAPAEVSKFLNAQIERFWEGDWEQLESDARDRAVSTTRQTSSSTKKDTKSKAATPPRYTASSIAPGGDLDAPCEEAEKKALQQLYEGNLRDAMQALRSFGTAPGSRSTADLLRKLHPNRLPNTSEPEWLREV